MDESKRKKLEADGWRVGSTQDFLADAYGSALEATPQELADSVAAIKRSLAQAAAGQTRDADGALDEIEARYGL